MKRKLIMLSGNVIHSFPIIFNKIKKIGKVRALFFKFTKIQIIFHTHKKDK